MVDRATPHWSAYTAAKAAQQGDPRGARELGPNGITVNLLATRLDSGGRQADADPADYRPEVPLGRMDTGRRGRMVTYLAPDAAGFVTVSASPSTVATR